MDKPQPAAMGCGFLYFGSGRPIRGNLFRNTLNIFAGFSYNFQLVANGYK